MKRTITALGILLTILIILLQTTSLPTESTILNRLDHLIYDFRFRLLKPTVDQNRQHRIVIVDLDEKSLSEVGQFPWPRQTLGTLVNKLASHGTLLVAFDIVFAEPERNPVDEIGALLSDQAIGRKQLIQQLQAQRSTFDGDQHFADVLKQHEVISGYLFHNLSNIRSGDLPTPLKGLPKVLPKSALMEMPGYSANIPKVQQAMNGGGFLTIIPDGDGTLRRVPLMIQHRQQVYGSLALEAARLYLLLDTIQPRLLQLEGNPVLQGLTLGQHWIPTDREGQMLIPYRGSRGHFPYISASDVLYDRVKPSEFQNALVFIGTSALGLEDLKTTPLGTEYPGVEAHATVTDALLSGHIPYTPDWAPGANVSLLMILGLLLSIWLPRCSSLEIAICTAITLTLIIGTNAWLWHSQGLNLPLAALLLLTLALGFFCLVSGYYQESQQREKVVHMFGQYVAPAHIERLLTHRDATHSFAGETKPMTVLFSDIRGFTAISEKLSAAELKQLLNDFFTPMTEIIFANQGTIDKYVGDMIMAFWGAPLEDPQQEQRAVHTALQMLERVEHLKQRFASLGLPPISIGIGINSGVMNVGDMGSIYRRAYTVLGDAVNLGSRLESITKFYGVDCLVSQSTREAVSDVTFRCVDRVQVVGKEEPINIFQPLRAGQFGELNLDELLRLYNRARDAYLQQNWSEASAGFEKLQELDSSSSRLYEIYLERIGNFASTPPGEDWEGVYRHQSK
mgnify:CR=1 FL=1